MSSSNWRAACAGVVLGLAVMGVWWARRPTESTPRQNVLLVTIDTLRADAVGAYGRPDTPTPLIDSLARAGVRFANAYAHNVVTLPSHANILTGQLPPHHGVRDNAGFRLAPEVETLATYLQRQGYRTGAFVSAFPLDSRFGLGAGFDVYDDTLTGGSRPAFLIRERPAERTVAYAKRWIDAAGPEPWFAWVHVYEPHFPYNAPARFASRWPDDPYLAEVAASDAALAPLLEPILAAGAEGHTVVVVTSDHGEALGEHGEASHGVFAYESVLRVPLVLYGPRIFGSRVVDVPVGHVDLLPTLLDALAFPISAPVAGRSLLPVVGGSENTVNNNALYFEALSASLNRGWAPLHGIIQDGFKYIDLPVPELYDLGRDPREVHNLAASDPGRAGALRARLDEFRTIDSPQSVRREPAEVRERLRSLGYVTGGTAQPPTVYTEADDPKRLIALDSIFQEVLDRYLAGDRAGALARSRELVRRRPSMAMSWMQLAQLERESGNATAAVDAMHRAVTLSPGDSEALALLGAYLTEAGRAREAADLLAPHAREPDADPDLLSTRALALARLEQFDAALAGLSRAREGDPSNAMLLVHVGTVEHMRGQRAAARAAFTEAIRLDPDLARPHTSLGVLALEEGRLEEATGHWRAATSLDPGEHGNILSLGIALTRGGRSADARACFEFFAANAPSSRYAAELGRVHDWLNGAR